MYSSVIKSSAIDGAEVIRESIQEVHQGLSIYIG